MPEEQVATKPWPKGHIFQYAEVKVRSLFRLRAENPEAIYMKPNYFYDCRPRNLSGPTGPTAILAEKYEGAAEGRMGTAAPNFRSLVALFLARFIAAALASNGFLYAFLFARLQVERVTLNLPDRIFLLNLELEAPKGVLQTFALLNPDLSQNGYTT